MSPCKGTHRGARVSACGGSVRGALGTLVIAVSALCGCRTPASTPGSPESQVQALVTRAEQRASARQWDDALTAWARVLEVDPFAYRAHVERARCYYHLGEYELEISEYRKALAINPSYPAALARLGHALLGQDELEEARAVYWRYLALVPDDAQVLFGLSQLEAKLGNLPASASLMERYRTVSPPQDVPETSGW